MRYASPWGICDRRNRRDVALYPKKRQKVWIWKAIDHRSGHLIDWECGPRNRHTLRKLLLRLEERGVVVYFTDHFNAYQCEIEDELLIQSKALTHGIERNNGQQRHWFARFRRKSIVVTKSIEMLNLTLKLFAAVHVNKTIDILQLVN